MQYCVPTLLAASNDCMSCCNSPLSISRDKALLSSPCTRSNSTATNGSWTDEILSLDTASCQEITYWFGDYYLLNLLSLEFEKFFDSHTQSLAHEWVITEYALVQRNSCKQLVSFMTPKRKRSIQKSSDFIGDIAWHYYFVHSLNPAQHLLHYLSDDSVMWYLLIESLKKNSKWSFTVSRFLLSTSRHCSGPYLTLVKNCF